MAAVSTNDTSDQLELRGAPVRHRPASGTHGPFAFDFTDSHTDREFVHGVRVEEETEDDDFEPVDDAEVKDRLTSLGYLDE